MKLKISDRKKKILMRFYKITLVILGLVLVIFNDTFGKLEGFIEFIAFYFILVFITIAHWIFKQIKSIIRLKNEKEKTELMHLKSQVNPHFFFNILNNLYGLVDKDSKKAQELILKLSDMMRYSIYEGQNETVLLSKEIDYLQNYIELHKMRYHKTIDIKFNHNITDDTYRVMPLLFIILLENAFKHGVENLRENAYVYITMTVGNNQVYFDIENNFDVSLTNESNGIGLTNLKRRLELVYPKDHSLSFSITKEVYKAQLNITKL
ncbi:histidine kinase [Flavobacteriales bacterium 33_180_T64]|nr:histidine kinase [Flavobacteriales bacterium 33_180_T64]